MFLSLRQLLMTSLEFFVSAESIKGTFISSLLYSLHISYNFSFNVLFVIFPKLYRSFTCSNTNFWSLNEIFYVPVCSCNHIHSNIRKNVTSSFPHFGHSGIVEAAREVFMQIEGNPGEQGRKYFRFSKLMFF